MLHNGADKHVKSGVSFLAVMQASPTANVAVRNLPCQVRKRGIVVDSSAEFDDSSGCHLHREGVLTGLATTLLAENPKHALRLTALAQTVSNTPELKNAYTALLSSVRLNAPTRSGIAILVTSTQPNEGKTTVASCLAITASLAGQRVLLVDGDLRRPSLGAAAGLDGAAGLTEILQGEHEASDAVHLIDLFEAAHDAGQFAVMAAGRKSATFLPAVDWCAARALFQPLTRRFDLVLVDSPPILAVNDALLLTGIVDGVLLVIDAGSADRDEVRRVKDQLVAIGTPVIGAVLNQFDPKIHGRAERPYRDYYLAPRR